MTREMEQENIENTTPSVEELEVIQETSPLVGAKEVLKETLPLGETQEILKEIPPSVEEQEVPKETSPSVDEQVVTKENPRSDEEQEVPKETSPIDEEQEVLKETLSSVEEQEVPKETSPSVDEQEVLKEIPTSEEQQVSKELVLSEVKQEVLLKESEIKQEPVDIQESNIYYVDDPTIVISDDDEKLDTTPVPLSLAITSPTRDLSDYAILQLFGPEHSGNVNKLYDYPPKRYLVKRPKRRASSVPRYMKLLTESGESDDAMIDSEGDNGNDFPIEVRLEPALKSTLKRKRCLIIPDNLEFENTRKTMKPGPKSKTRNIATVHDMINEAKRLGLGPSIGLADSSDEEMSVDSDNLNDEIEIFIKPQIIIDSIDLTSDDEADDIKSGTVEFIIDDNETSQKDAIEVTSSDDEADVIKAGTVEFITDDIKSGTVECVIDNNETSEKIAKENSINDENKIIDNTVSEILNDKTNETENVTEVLKNAIDSNKIKEDENTKDKSDNGEVEEKNSLNDTNEPIGVGEKQ